MKKLLSFNVISLFVVCCSAANGIHLPFYFNDNMTLQQGAVIPIKGTATPMTKVNVSFGKQKMSVKADAQGKFCAHLKPLKAGGTYTLCITTKTDTCVLSNIQVGDVWLCSGQSNMAFELREARTAKEALNIAKNENLRLMMFHPRQHTDAVAFSASLLDSLNKGQYWKPVSWKTSNSNNARDFSAIGYFFGQRIQHDTKIPVGLICTAVGGAPIESYIDSTYLRNAFPAIFAPFATNKDIQDWVRGRAYLNIKNSNDIEHQWHPYKPTCLYYQSVALLKDFPIKGIIWYQGESNAQDEKAHALMFRALVKSWRNAWQQPALPFYFVQLSSIERDNWPEFRFSQYLLSEEIPHTGIAVSSDLGHKTDVHPRHKEPIGERLARLALNRTYGMQQEDQGPEPVKLTVVKGTPYAVCKVKYAHADGLSTSDGQAPRTFELAGENGKFYPAQAYIDAESATITLVCRELPVATQMRYGWQPYTTANLINKDGLPASTYWLEVRG